jgi:hypothetical protein
MDDNAYNVMDGDVISQVPANDIEDGSMVDTVQTRGVDTNTTTRSLDYMSSLCFFFEIW